MSRFFSLSLLHVQHSFYRFYQSAIVFMTWRRKPNRDAFRSDSTLEKTRQTQRNTRRSGFQPSWQRSVNSSVVSRRTYSQVEARLAEKEGVWLVGDSLTWADLYLFHYLTSWAAAIPDLLKPLPKCRELVEAVQEIPLLKEWIAVRPKTPM